MAPLSRSTIPLGEQLYWWRTHHQWSRRQLAERAGIAISTLQSLEAGRGTLTYYITALRALGLKLHAAGLGNRNLGTALVHERTQQTISRRELARHLAVSRTTLAKLDSNRSVRLATIEAYAQSIGVRLIVRPITGHPTPRRPRVRTKKPVH